MKRDELNSVVGYDKGYSFDFSCTKNCIYDNHIIFMVSWCGRDSYFNNEIFNLVTLKLLMLYLVHHDHLYQELDQNVLYITNIQVEGEIYGQN